MPESTCWAPFGNLPRRAPQARRALEEARRGGAESADAAREYWLKILPEAVEAFDMRVRRRRWRCEAGRRGVCVCGGATDAGGRGRGPARTASASASPGCGLRLRGARLRA